MATTLSPVPAAAEPAVPDVPIYRLSLEQYLAMVEAGILTEDDPVEFLEGWLVQKMTQNPPHMVACVLILQALPRVIPVGWFLAIQSPITSAGSLPEPEGVVIRGSVRDYLSRRWGAEDAGLVIEVSHSTIEMDQGSKKRIYARAGVPIYWIVNIDERRIEVYTDPTGPVEAPDYRQRRDFLTGESVPLVLDGQTAGEVAVIDILP
jgi:Uma2 family endonuclease